MATPTGIVTLIADGVPQSTATLDGSGNYSFTLATLPVGTHSITVSYAGDANFAPSVSPVVSQVVNGTGPAPSTTTLASSENPSNFGDNVTFSGGVS